jgi:hypothetical protein
MRLDAQEKFALSMLFNGADPFSAAVLKQLDTAEVTERRSTGVGFFTMIHFADPLPDAERAQWDWNFAHNGLSHGGSFMSWRESAETIGLEGVSHHGEWPGTFDPSDFRGT